MTGANYLCFFICLNENDGKSLILTIEMKSKIKKNNLFRFYFRIVTINMNTNCKLNISVFDSIKLLNKKWI